MKTFLIILALAILIVVIYMLVKNTDSQAQGVSPHNAPAILGTNILVGNQNSLFKCSWKPNCISSTDATDDEHYYPAVKFNENQFIKLVTVLQSMSNIKIIKNETNYIHAVASTTIGFKDDLEFYFDSEKMICHIRSQSRVGTRDFGVNKKRIDDILQLLNV